METTPAPPDIEVTKNLVREYLTARDLRDEATERMERWADVLVEVLGEAGRCELEPGIGVRVQAGTRRFDPALAGRLLSQDALTRISAMVPSSSLAKQHLTPAELHSVQSQGRPTLRLLG